MARNGKIARLSVKMRHELNERLEEGASAAEVLPWLNGLPEVQKRLKETHGGRPVNEQNLSDWRQGGFRDWQRLQEMRGLRNKFVERSEELQLDCTGMGIGDQMAVVLTVEVARMAEACLEDEQLDMEARWKRLREVLRELAVLRRGDQQSLRARTQREKWEVEGENRREEEYRSRSKERRMAIELLPTMSKIYGEEGAARRLEDDYGLEYRELDQWMEKNNKGKTKHQKPNTRKAPKTKGEKNRQIKADTNIQDQTANAEEAARSSEGETVVSGAQSQIAGIPVGSGIAAPGDGRAPGLEQRVQEPSLDEETVDQGESRQIKVENGGGEGDCGRDGRRRRPKS